jgi:hypothetical protein
MKNKGSLIVAVVVLAVILETGLISAMENKPGVEGPSEDVSVAADHGVAGYSDDLTDCVNCLIGADPHDHAADRPSNCQKNICGEHMLVRPNELPTTSWNFKSTWKVTTGTSSAFRSTPTVEVAFYSDGRCQAVRVILGYDEGSAASTLDGHTFDGGYAGIAGITQYAWGGSMNASVINERGLTACI